MKQDNIGFRPHPRTLKHMGIIARAIARHRKSQFVDRSETVRAAIDAAAGLVAEGRLFEMIDKAYAADAVQLPNHVDVSGQTINSNLSTHKPNGPLGLHGPTGPDGSDGDHVDAIGVMSTVADRARRLSRLIREAQSGHESPMERVDHA